MLSWMTIVLILTWTIPLVMCTSKRSTLSIAITERDYEEIYLRGAQGGALTAYSGVDSVQCVYACVTGEMCVYVNICIYM